MLLRYFMFLKLPSTKVVQTIPFCLTKVPPGLKIQVSDPGPPWPFCCFLFSELYVGMRLLNAIWWLRDEESHEIFALIPSASCRRLDEFVHLHGLARGVATRKHNIVQNKKKARRLGQLDAQELEVRSSYLLYSLKSKAHDVIT